MIPLSLAEIAAVVGGRPHDIPDPAGPVTGPVVIDSREVAPGACSPPSPVSASTATTSPQRAVAAGAVAVLATRPVGVPAIVVDDVAAALGALARARRRAPRRHRRRAHRLRRARPAPRT